MKKFLKGFLFILLILAGTVLLLVRYPTTAPVVSSTFAPKPDLDHLPPLKITWIPTGTSRVWVPFAIRGGSLGKTIKMVYGGILVEHPKGSFLIDGGLGKDAQGEMARNLGVLHKLFPIQVDSSISEQREKFPGLKNIQSIYVTHVHWDHLSGAKDFPEIPIYLLPEEIEFINQGSRSILPVVYEEQRKALQSRFRPIQLKEHPYENFSRSLDLFEDGSVVLVPLPGHTPGSLGIFLNVSPTERYLVVGDALWNVNDNGEPEARSLPAEWFADNDVARARETRARLTELVKKSNEITLVPVHDPGAVEIFTK
jgi:glyoxylase-like metal-dependent hydrolase (beta-lactamase superfamily II)